MSELPQSGAGHGSASTVAASAKPAKPYWLFRFAAWVGIVAGIVFVVAVVFISGAKLTHHDCWHDHHHGHHHDHYGHDHSMGHGADHHQHGSAPAAPGAGAPGPAESPRPIAPSPAPVRP